MTPPQINFRDPKIVVRAILGALLCANLVAAAFAFHLIGDSPAQLDRQLASDRLSLRAVQQHLNRSEALTHNMERSREQGGKFLADYMTTRRYTFSTIGREINTIGDTAGMKVGDVNDSVLDPIEGASDLDILTITATFQGNYAQLVKFVNLLDRSPRFLLIESLQVTPQPKGDILNATVKLNTFVRDDNGGAQ